MKTDGKRSTNWLPAISGFANPKSIITGSNYRFTILKDRLIRMEFCAGHGRTGQCSEFEDRCSQAFLYRNQPEPGFSFVETGIYLQIETDFLVLNYKKSISATDLLNVSILVKKSDTTWHFGDHLYYQGGNLGGTFRTLDRVSGSLQPDPGLIGRYGWSLIDDSSSLVFNEDGWLCQRSHPDHLDLYFFGYGRDYIACLEDFCSISGKVPMIPRWILGNWWSRYWEYSDQELLELMNEFRMEAIPISVCIVDMDWHLTNTGNESSGWTGYTWNKHLFPDPAGFIEALHQLGLRTALNLHPASGVWPHEEAYKDFALYMDMDPDEKKPIPFDCSDPQFMRAYFELLHHPQERIGVDFWWLDWQQGSASKVSGLDPLWWLNHLHFLDLGRDGRHRPFIFSRWGGLGNHRYPIGFSGDTVVSWEVLNFLPEFTSTSANVQYGWWSHDIGGHMGGVEEDELFARWVQYGVFSPIFRLHSTKNMFHERRPWKRSAVAKKAASEAMRFRHRLIPYLYSMAWRNHVDSVPVILPMYYSNPEDENAYQCPQQYWFGSEMVAAPFTTPINPDTGLSKQVVWLPGSGWYNLFSGKYYPRGGWQAIHGTLDEIPVFAKPGAIIPLAPEIDWGGGDNPKEFSILIFPGAENRFLLYEDDGDSIEYLNGNFAITSMTLEAEPDQVRFTLNYPKQPKAYLPGEREIYLVLHGINVPDNIGVFVDGEPCEASSSYRPESKQLRIGPIHTTKGNKIKLIVPKKQILESFEDDKTELVAILSAMKIETDLKERIFKNWEKIKSGELSLHSYYGLKDSHISVLCSLMTT